LLIRLDVFHSWAKSLEIDVVKLCKKLNSYGNLRPFGSIGNMYKQHPRLTCMQHRPQVTHGSQYDLICLFVYLFIFRLIWGGGICKYKRRTLSEYQVHSRYPFGSLIEPFHVYDVQE